MLEQFRNEGTGELILIQDDERLAIVRPSYELGVVVVEEAVPTVSRRPYDIEMCKLPAQLLDKRRYCFPLALCILLRHLYLRI